MKGKYYSISFGYSWKEDAQVATATVDSYVDAFLCGTGLPFIHEYTWPDGSCYKIVRAECGRLELQKRLNDLLDSCRKRVPYHIKVDSIEVCSGSDKTQAGVIEDRFKSAYPSDFL